MKRRRFIRNVIIGGLLGLFAGGAKAANGLRCSCGAECTKVSIHHPDDSGIYPKIAEGYECSACGRVSNYQVLRFGRFGDTVVTKIPAPKKGTVQVTIRIEDAREGADQIVTYRQGFIVTQEMMDEMPLKKFEDCLVSFTGGIKSWFLYYTRPDWCKKLGSKYYGPTSTTT